MTQDELIARALEQILDIWQVDTKDLRQTGPKGFDWLPGSHLVRVRAVPVDPKDPTYLMLQNMSGVDPRENGVRLSVTTRLLKEFPINDTNAINLLNKMAPMLSSTYSLVYPPTAIIEAANGPQGPFDLELFSSVYIDKNLLDWLPKFFAQATIMQAIDAELSGYSLPDVLGGGQPAYEEGNKSEQLDGIFDVREQIFVPEGLQPSRWQGSDEFADFVEKFGKSEGCIANADPKGLTAEVPFGNETALIQCWTDQSHPKLGNGLLVTLQLPYGFADHTDVGAAALNFFESRTWTEVPNFGCWHSRNIGSARGTVPAHSTFIPNTLYRPGLIQNLILWEAGRTRWVRHTFFPELRDALMSEIYEERFRGD